MNIRTKFVNISVLIGIDASRAFIKERTGIEEYSYQVIKHLMDKLEGHQVILYTRKDQEVDYDLPLNWRIKKMWLPYFTSQMHFSLEFLFNPIDTLFVPAHTVPPIHPRNTVVVIHGLEYEIVPAAYSLWARFYMSVVIRNSCRWAKKIIAVSNNTRRDLMKLYKVPREKIEVIYEGVSTNYLPRRLATLRSGQAGESSTNMRIVNNKPYLLFIGRLEERKNIIGIIKTFEILKEQYKIPHKLVLAGKFGYGEDRIREEIKNVNCANDIILTGYINEEEKWGLLKNADVFLFPTFYEGFGLPILEAQSVGCPVIAGNNSSIPELVNLEAGLPSALLVDPHNAEDVADAAYKLISDENLRNDIIKRGYENVARFSWERCADSIANLLTI